MRLKKILGRQGLSFPPESTEIEICQRICKFYSIEPGLEIMYRPAKQVISEITMRGSISKEEFRDLLAEKLIRFHVRRNERLQRKISAGIDLVHGLVIANTPGRVFYSSPEWLATRYQVLHVRGNRCEACGTSAQSGAEIHVDHIKPRSIFPELALDPDNLQVLCKDCNVGKSNVYLTDWRSERAN
jgi:5-methylcytosine-specific restriction endonuclease McrA